MGGVLASLAAQAACCCGSAACSLCCSGCPSTRSSTTTRLAYLMLLILSFVAACILMDPWIGNRLEELSSYTGTLKDCSTKDCAKRWSHLGVFRAMWAPTVLFAVMAVVTVGVRTSRDVRSHIQNGFWGIKLLLLIGLSVAAFFIKNQFFLEVWGWIGLVGVALFILLQMVLLIDLAHSWADAWVERMSSGSSCHSFGLMLASLLLYGGIIGVSVCLFIFYTDSSSACKLNKFFIGFNLALIIIMTVIAMLPRVRAVVPNSGILQSGVLGFFMTWLTWTAVTNTNTSCEPSQSASSNIASTVVGCTIALVTVAYASIRTVSASQLGKMGTTEQSGAAASGSESDEPHRQRVVDDEEDGVRYSWSFLHITLALASLFLMMVLVKFASINDGHTADITVGRGYASMWVVIVFSWLSALLYFWTLVAPLCCPGRDFS